MLSKKQKELILEWTNQVPILGFNSGKYDLNLIRNYFVEQMCQAKDKTITVGKKGNTIMFMKTSEFKFLDIVNYVGPGVSYNAWVKAYGCQYTKSWFPYEWFDSLEKLDFPSLPDYPHWHSKLKNGFTLTLEEWKSCKKLFKDKNMKTFADWLEYYNNLEVLHFVTTSRSFGLPMLISLYLVSQAWLSALRVSRQV